jgi:hypothetical protein
MADGIRRPGFSLNIPMSFKGRTRDSESLNLRSNRGVGTTVL